MAPPSARACRRHVLAGAAPSASSEQAWSTYFAEAQARSTATSRRTS
eukprot:CAMPEP_0171191906 /NCGR_PEP_ID=MMETSP0790-20130122/19600_1 /TAXON_ID=2925 /ORGANISM="Alexandrium catenella, Strain OF101" /LENGTH=46 /DNA_ID= /DNA_START= /DNA_END= /DNA_ORIENTATION=